MYVDVYDAIMAHLLHAGTKLTEQGLGDIYGLARHHVRRVLARLAADGLVDLERNRGARIASPGAREAQDMFELRQVLEAKVMDKLAGHLTDADGAALRDMIARERDAWMRGDRPLWVRLSADFHIELAKLAGNALIVDALRRLVSRTTLLISNLDTAGRQPCSFDEHAAVVDALQEPDGRRARAQMARHLDQCACRLLARAPAPFDLRSALGKA